MFVLNEISMTHLISQCSFCTDLIYCTRLLSPFVYLVTENHSLINKYLSKWTFASWHMLWHLGNTFKLTTSHMALAFPSPPMWCWNSPPHHPCLISWLHYLKILLFSQSVDCLILFGFLCCVDDRHSVKKETLKRMEFLLLQSLWFSQFWKLDIKQVSKRDHCKYVYLIYKNLHCLTLYCSGTSSCGHSTYICIHPPCC